MRRRLRLFPVLVAVLLATVGGVPAADSADPPRRGATLDVPIESEGVERRGAIDVGRLPSVPDRDVPALPVPPPVDEPHATRDVAAGPDPVDVTWTDAPTSIQPGWAGIVGSQGGIDEVSSRVAVGPEHIVQVIEGKIVMYDREGSNALPTTQLGGPRFFDLPFGFGSGDGQVVYDSLQARWVMAEASWVCDSNQNGTINDPVGFLDFAISRTSDPTGMWDIFYFGWEDYLPRDISIGTSTDKFALSADLVEMSPMVACDSPAAQAGPVIFVMDWKTFATPDPATIPYSDITFSDDGAGGAYRYPQVAVQAPATSATLYAVVQYQIGASSTPEYAAITGSPTNDSIDFPSNLDLTGAGIVGSWVDTAGAEQPGAAVLGVSDPRPASVKWQSGRMTWVSNHGCQPDGDSELRTCVRVTQIATTGTGFAPSARQDFLLGEASAYHFDGAAAVSLDGTLHVVWTRSADAPAGQITSLTGYQLPGDADDHLSGPAIIQPGTGDPFEGSWAQNFDMAMDPQVPNAVWQGHGYATDDHAWATHVAQLQTGGATYVPITPARVMDSRTATGVSGSYSSSTPRTFDVAGVGAIPDDAIAVTGNLTVTGQTSAGYVALTSTATSTPRSSTLNVPTGDTRANNVTATLASNGRLAAVWKGTGGSKAHLLLDITGYFVAGEDDAAYTPFAPVRVLDSRAGIGTGLTGRFSSSVPRKLTVAGTNGIPADALAITANLTVVGQTSGGYVSVTTTSNPSPSTSNLNFPSGDVRANGLTAKLQGGAVWLVFKGTSNAARTDLLLDVTGYYLADGDGLTFYPLEAGRIMDTRTSVLSGLTGTFKSSTPRRLDVDGHWGVPAGAEAITGNLTVVGQTGAGYVSMTTTSTATPTTSTINVPVGDTRANGITAPLNGSGNAFLVYKSSSGRTTHLILDVTGYFR